MNRRAMTTIWLGRALGFVAVLAALGYLTWRVGWSILRGEQVSGWLAVGSLAVEVAAVCTTGLLIWVLARPWPQRDLFDAHLLDRLASSEGGSAPTWEVVIDAAGASANDLRTTLVALDLTPPRVPVVIVDVVRREEITRVAVEFGRRCTAVEPKDATGIRAALDATRAQIVMLIAAGDVPAPSMTASVAAAFDDPAVVAAQAVIASTPSDIDELERRGHRAHTFQHGVLPRAIAAQGLAMLAGSGLGFRRSAAALLDDQPRPLGMTRHRALWELSLRIAEARRVVALVDDPLDGGALIAVAPMRDANGISADHRARTAAAWQLVVGPHGVLRSVGLRLRQRLAGLAWSASALDGARWLAAIAVILGSLLAGLTPGGLGFGALLGVAGVVFASAALMVLSGATVMPGDRVRSALRPRHLALPVAVAINAVLVMRAVSDRFTHAMRALDIGREIALMAIAIGLLAVSLDSLRLLAKRRARRAVRIDASTSGSFGDSAIDLLDITMHGAGLLSLRWFKPGETARLDFTVVSESGVTSLSTMAVVRNATPDVAGAWRLGVEFVGADAYALNTLAEVCVIAPARQVLAGAAGPLPATPSDRAHDVVSTTVESRPRSLVLRLGTLVALAGVVSSIAPEDVAASSSGGVSADSFGHAPVIVQAIVIGLSALLALSLVVASSRSAVSRAPRRTSRSGNRSLARPADIG